MCKYKADKASYRNRGGISTKDNKLDVSKAIL